MSSASAENRAWGSASRIIESPWLAGTVMFACFLVVAVCAVQRQYGLAVAAPRSAVLTMGGVLDGLGRLLGLATMSYRQLTVVYMSTLFVMYAVYAWALIVTARRRGAASPGFIIGASMIFCLLVLFTPPILAKDLFNYASYGRALAVYGKNPYVAAPSMFRSEPMLQYISWRNTPSVYGPLFNYISAALGVSAGKSAVTNTIAFKLLAFSFYAGSLFVINDLARRLTPDRRSFVLLAAAWNPLVIIHLVGGGHNDTIMIFFVVAGFLLYRKGYPVLAIGSVVLAGMIKTTALFVLAPMLVLFLRQNARWGLRKYAEAAAVLILVPLALYLPTWPGIKGFKLVMSVSSEYSAASVPRFFRGQLTAVLRGLGWTGSAAGRLSASATHTFFVLVFLLLFVLFCYRVRDMGSMIFYAGAIMFCFTFTTTWLMPWYAGFLVVLVALSGSYRFTAAAAGVTLVMSLYGRGINGWTNSVFPLLMLAICVVLAAETVLERFRPALATGRA